MRKTTFRVLTGVAVVLLLLGIVYGIALAISTAKLRRAYAALQADGRPMERGDVIPPHVEDINNAALLYQSAILLLRAEPSGHGRESLPDNPREWWLNRERPRNLFGCVQDLAGSLSTEESPSPETQQDLKDLKDLMGRKVVDDALAIIQQGVQRPACREECTYYDGLDMRRTLPDLLGMRDLTRLIGIKARLEAEAGNMDRAWDLVVTQTRFSDALRSSPFRMSQLVRIGMIGLSCDTIQDLCATALPGTEQHEQLEAILTSFDDVTPMVRAVDGERLIRGEWLFTLPDKKLYATVRDLAFSGEIVDFLVEPETEFYSGIPDFLAWPATKWLTLKPVLLADHANYVRIMHAHARSMSLPYASAAPKGDCPRFSLTALILPTVWRIRQLNCRMIARVRMTRVGLALLRYRAEHGTLPATLDVLNLAGLSDPFTEEALHYRPEGEGFLLYSVGEDQKDNGGIAEPVKDPSLPPALQSRERDIPWRFPRAPQAAQ